MSNIALIPARGNSKSIPRKNLIDFNGKPLIFWTIDAAIKSKNIDEVYVSSEDDEILNISKSFGASVIKRPLELSDDKTSSDKVIEHFINCLEKKYDIETVCFLQPTSPLRTSIHIDDAYDYFNKNNLKGLISGYYPEKNEILKSFKVISHGMIEGLISPDSPYTRRQDLPKTFMSNGALYLFKPYDFKYENKIPRSGMNLYEMSKESSLDIDTYNDLNFKV
tara:strand:+ start:963 stop:1628 length:666 start_codon:yes stop_codon:yes gene_type:complete